MEILFQGYILLVAALGAFLITYWSIPVIINISHVRRLFDDPTEDRKLHVSSIPNLGGVGIFAAVVVVFTISGFALKVWSPYLMAGLTLLFFSGIKDDIMAIDPLKKLGIQIVAIVALMVGGELVITNMGGVLGFHEISYSAGFGLTFFTMVVVVNAYNLIDGIDGLAAGIGIMASLFFGWWFWQSGMTSVAILAFALAGSLAAFIRYNFEPASIFMGDTGSQVVGYLLAFLAVSFVQTGVTATVSVPFQNAVPVLVLSVLIVPLYDTLRVFVVRVLNGGSPFRADRSHVHHQLIDMGFSHSSASYILYAYTIAMVSMTIIFSSAGVNILLASILCTTVLLFPTMRIKRRLFKKVGISMPTERQIKIFELKYGGYLSPKDNNGVRIDRSDQDSDHYEEVAV